MKIDLSAPPSFRTAMARPSGPGIAEFGTRSIPGPTWATSRVIVYVDEVDGHFEQAENCGATIIAELADHGPNRIYVASDCGGQQWIFGSPIG